MNIALVGSAPSSVHLAPYNSPDWDIWACSPGAFGIAKNVKAWFEVHRYEPGQPWFSEGYCNYLQNATFPVYMAEPDARVKTCVPLPIDQLVDKYGPYHFNSTLSYMMAMAIEAGAKKIALYGVDMAANEEYFSQKMGCIHFALLAQSMGIEVGTPPESDLFTPPPLYGICETNHAFIKGTARGRELAARHADAEQRIAVAKEEMMFLKGAIDDNKYQQQTWAGNMQARGREFVSPKAGTTQYKEQGLDEFACNTTTEMNSPVLTSVTLSTDPIQCIKDLDTEINKTRNKIKKPKGKPPKKSNGKAANMNA